MGAFDKVIGYEAIKTELIRICDMIGNSELYDDFGATMPKGILIYGEPGLGKTLMAKCFIEESGLPAYTVRKNKGTNDFVEKITYIFERAKANSPSIVFLDDLDKFANADESRRDAEEYIAVQAGIDDVKDFDVFVIATANNIVKLPASLKRSGRFDKKIEVCTPSADDASTIMKYYLRNKMLSDDVNLDDVCKMINYQSCAEIENIMNDAAIHAAYERKTSIEMKDLVNAVLRKDYHVTEENMNLSVDQLKRVALHEAGHLVVCEILCPESVGLASLLNSGSDTIGGFIRRCKELDRRSHHILVTLAGKTAVELYYAESHAGGCQSDLKSAYKCIREAVSKSGTCGIGVLDVSSTFSMPMSESLNVRTEAVIHSEMERYMLKAKDILIKNRAFLEKITNALIEKKTLLYSDIQRIKKSALANETFSLL